MNLFETLLHPDQEELENGERRFISQAANVLQIGEFQFLQVAYRDWHDRDIPERILARLFASYMLASQVPHWANHYARKILTLDERGLLNDQDPVYHRYDQNYRSRVPLGGTKLAITVALLAALIGGSLALSYMSVGTPATLFPPYLNVEELDLQPRQVPLQPPGPGGG